MPTLDRRTALTALTAASGGAAVAGWSQVVSSQWDRLMALGTLCSHGGLLVHCAACLPAAGFTALTIVGLALISGNAADRPALERNRG